MFDTEHPTYRELLLLDSGELDSGHAATVELHLAGCQDCQAEFAKVQIVCGAVATSAEPPKQAHNRSFVKRLARPALAVIVALSVTGYLLTQGTQTARANEVLQRAIAKQTLEPARTKVFRIQGLSGQCYTANDVIFEQVATGDRGFCNFVTSTLHTVGWEGKDLLSAKRFNNWRSSLSKKKDSIREADGATKITTTTNESPILLASLSIRNSDDHPIAARYEFELNQGEHTTFDVIETEDLSPVATINPATSLSPTDQPVPAQEAIPNILPVRPEANPADLLEIHVRLALRDAGSDGSPTLDVEKISTGFRVWGVVPDEKTKQILRENLQDIPGIVIEVISEAESQRAEKTIPIPWSGFRGDAPPLAEEKLSELFLNDPQGRQQFLKDLDSLTRRLAGQTRTRDALLNLITRVPSGPDTVKLNHAVSDMDSQVFRSSSQLAKQLHPLVGALTPKRTQKLTFQQAMELYAVVHQTVLLSSGNSDLTLQQAISRISKLLQ